MIAFHLTRYWVKPIAPTIYSRAHHPRFRWAILRKLFASIFWSFVILRWKVRSIPISWKRGYCMDKFGFFGRISHWLKANHGIVRRLVALPNNRYACAIHVYGIDITRGSKNIYIVLSIETTTTTRWRERGNSIGRIVLTILWCTGSCRKKNTAASNKSNGPF